MKSLADLSIVKVVDPKVHHLQVYKDAEAQYIQNWWQRIQQTKKIHFMRLCKWYYVNALLGNKCAYKGVDFSEMPHWKVAQWAACEMCFGYYHNNNEPAIVTRIFRELEFEHIYKRELDFSRKKIIDAIKLHCPELKGTVHDWYKVLLHVPKKILQYEEFFG